MEFQMQTDLATTMQGVSVKFNFEELKDELALQLEKYQNLIVSEDAISEAKKDRAKLRKLADALNDEKIRVKKAFTEPYTVFENQVKELISMCKAPADAIDEQVKAFEEKKKLEKKASIEAYFNSVGERVKEFYTFADIFDPRWLNLSYKMEDALKDVDTKVLHIEADIKSIETLCEQSPAMAESLKDCYKMSRSIPAVIAHKNALERAAKRIEEEREERKRIEEQRAKWQEVKIDGAIEEPVAETVEQEKTYSIDLRFTATKHQLEALKLFLNRNNIAYEKIGGI